MEYVIGMDGGATKTRCTAFNRDMSVMFSCPGKSSNLTSLSEKEVQHNLSDLLDRFFSESGLAQADCAGLCLGSAGAGRENARQELKNILQGLLPPGVPVRVTDDALPALVGGVGGGPGIMVISGTGSICMGRDSRGRVCRAGGWGHIMGDEGGGYDMACRMLRAVAKAQDSRGEATLLTELIFNQWGLKDMDGLSDSLYRSDKGKSEIASLAFLCDIAYDKGDKTAARIMEDCGTELAELVAAVARKLGEPGLTCLCAGSVLEKSPYLRGYLQSELAEKAPGVKLAACKHDAAWGCGLLAWEEAGGAG